MKLENQVCTLEQGYKIEKLGITAEPQNYWVFDSGMKWKVVPTGYFYKEEEGIEYRPAFTTAELGLVLPFGEYDTAQWDYGWRIYTNKGDDAIGDFFFKSEASARAALLIYLLENNIVTAADVSQRLQNA